MPIYQCFSPGGLLDESTRVKLAAEITRIHCDATGIPPSFVNVMFFDLPDGTYFVAGKPSAHSVVNGAIRFGRDLATRQRILRTCRKCGLALPASRSRSFSSRFGRIRLKTRWKPDRSSRHSARNSSD